MWSNRILLFKYAENLELSEMKIQCSGEKSSPVAS